MITFKEKVGGQFTLRKRDVNTGKVVQEVGPFSNLITNLGLNRIGVNANPITRCYVGTGTVPPTVTDANMSAFLVATTTRLEGPSIPPAAPTWYSEISFVFTFAAGTVNNNITEVGVGWSTNPLNALWSRELIVDSAGNPIAITVLATEILEVVYTLRQYHDVTDFTGSFVLNGNTYNYTGRPVNLGGASLSYSSPCLGLAMTTPRTGAVTLGAVTGTLTGGAAAGLAPSGAPDTYVDGSLTLSYTSSFSLTQGNSPTGIKAFVLQPGGGASSFLYNSKQILLDTPIPKTELNTMSFTWAYSWDRYTPPSP